MAAPLATNDPVSSPDSASGEILSSLSSIGLCIAAIVATLADSEGTRVASAILFLVFLIFNRRYFGLREGLLVALSLLITGIAVWVLGEDVLQPVIFDLNRATYLCAFIMLMTSLRYGAMSSDAVLAIGRYMTGQTTGRRYFSLHVGGHFMGVLLNFGAISLLGPLIKRGVDSKAHEVSPLLSALRLRRQISALCRGFSWFNLWAPTSIALAVVLTTVPGSQPGIIALSGMIIALIMLLVGWTEDRYFGARIRRRMESEGTLFGRTPAPDFPRFELLRFLGVAFSLLALAWFIHTAFHVSLAAGIMMAAVPTSIVWIVVQWMLRGDHSATKLTSRIGWLFRRTLPEGSPEAATLGLAGYMGLLGAKLVDRDWIVGAADLDGSNPAIVCIAVTAIIPLASCLGLPPMMTVTFLGGLLASIPELSINPTVLGMSLLVGWSLNLTGSPFAATSLILSRVIGVSTIDYAWRWNGVFTLLSWAVVASVIYVLTGLLN